MSEMGMGLTAQPGVGKGQHQQLIHTKRSQLMCGISKDKGQHQQKCELTRTQRTAHTTASAWPAVQCPQLL